MHDKKAMASMVDAVIFTVILGLLVVNFVIPHQLTDENAIDNGPIHDDMLQLRFNASPIFPELGNISLSVSEMVAIEMNRAGNSSFPGLLTSVMQALLGSGRPWLLTFIHDGRTLNFGTEHLDQAVGIVMTERSVTAGSMDTITSRLYVL